MSTADDDFVDGETPKGWFRTLLIYITTSPSDLHMIFSEQFEAIDWDSKARDVARPVGISLTVLFYLLRLLQDNVIKLNYYKSSKHQNAFDLSKSETLKSMPYLAQYYDTTILVEWKYYTFLTILDRATNCTLFALAMLNLNISYKYLIAQFRSYSIFGSTPQIESPNLTKHSLDDLTKSYYEDISKKTVWSMLKYFIFEKTKGEMLEYELNDQFFYKLTKWTPTKFITQIFVYFNPINICFLWFTDVSFRTLIVILFNWAVLQLVILKRYEVKITDESIIHAATIDDINKKIVESRTNKVLQNVMIDATNPKVNFVRFSPAIRHNPIFLTHSLNGEVIREMYNTKNQEFEDIPDEMTSHNMIQKHSRY